MVATILTLLQCNSFDVNCKRVDKMIMQQYIDPGNVWPQDMYLVIIVINLYDPVDLMLPS